MRKSTYIPKGCDYQGRLIDGKLVFPAEAVTELIEDQQEPAGPFPIVVIVICTIIFSVLIAWMLK